MADNRFHRDASGRFTFEMFRIPADSYPTISKEIVTVFNLVPAGPVIAAWDTMFRDYRRGEAVIDLAWDNWSGLLITAKGVAAEPLVRQIGVYLLGSSWARRQEPSA